MPSFLNPVFGLLMLRAGVEGDTVTGPEVRRPGEQSPAPRPDVRCGARSRPVRAGCASRATRGRDREPRRRAESRWVGRCGSADPRGRSRAARHRPPCPLR